MHNPPWKSVHNSWSVTSIYDASGKLVCQLSVDTEDASEGLQDRMLRNSLLIAAAPKLAELLESAAIVLRQHHIDTTEIDAVIAEVKGDKS